MNLSPPMLLIMVEGISLLIRSRLSYIACRQIFLSNVTKVEKVVHPFPKKITYAIVIFTVLLGLISSATLFFQADDIIYIYGDRDLWRGLHAFERWPYLGPEFNAGPRSPGGLFYYILGAALAVSQTIGAIMALKAVMLIMAALTLGGYVSLRYGATAGVTAGTSMLGSGILLSYFILWNPSYLHLFSTLAIISLHEWMTKKSQPGWALAFGLAVGLGSQIHSQILSFIPAALVCMVVFRAGFGRRDLAFVMMGLIIPLTPYAIMDLRNGGYEIAALLSNNDVAKHTASESAGVVEHISNIASDLWDISGATANFLPKSIQNSYFILYLGTWASDVVLAVAAVIGALSTMAMYWRSKREQSVSAGMVFIIVCVVHLIFLGLMNRHIGRYLLAVIPAASAVLGLSVYYAGLLLGRGSEGRGTTRTRVVGLMVLMVIGAVGWRVMVWGAVRTSDANWNANSIAAKTEIATYLSEHFSGLEAFYTRTVVLDRENAELSLEMKPVYRGRMSFIVDSLNATGDDSLGCVIVAPKLEGRDIGEEVLPFLKMKTFGSLKPSVVRFEETTHFGYLWYETEDGNCASSVQNAYVPTKDEDKHVNKYTWAQPGEFAEDTEAGVFFTVKESRFRAPFGLEMSLRGKELEITLHGKLLRGFTYFEHRVWRRPTVVFSRPNGEQKHIVLTDDLIGHEKFKHFAPWKKRTPVLEDGLYTVSLLVDELDYKDERTDAEGVSAAYELGTIRVQSGSLRSVAMGQ